MSRPISDTAPARGKGRVQLSTSIPEGLRQDVVELVRRRGTTISAVVEQSLSRTVRESKRSR